MDCLFAFIFLISLNALTRSLQKSFFVFLYKEAISSFKKAIKLKSDNADFYYNLAYAYKNLNNEKEYQKAIDTYNKLKENE